VATDTTGYRPGYCNIGERQRRSRLRVAVAGFAGVVAGPVPRELLVAVFVPLAVGYEWGLQASTAFCVRLAVGNRYDFGRGASGTVDDPGAQQDDQLQAVKITAASLLLAMLTTGLVVVLLG
jgi:hypothetical protein